MTQAKALEIMLSGRSVFLTGAPGAGKTYVLNEFVRRARRRRRIAVTASTGIAATHIGGTTIHLWSGLGTRSNLTGQDQKRLLANERLRRRYRETDVLIIDEVSMLHGARLDLVNEACRLMRGNSAPFGGLQVVLVGDLFQLPPVTHEGGGADFVHAAAAWTDLDPAVCYLTEQHRQQNDRLLDLLQAMRQGTLQRGHLDLLNERLSQQPSADAPIVWLCTHNRDAHAENARRLATLTGPSRTYVAATTGVAADLAELRQGVLAPGRLELKKGAEVMFVVNNPEGGYVNGSRGRVTGFRLNLPRVRLTTDRTVTVKPHSWTLAEHGHERARIVQLPLRLGWAITIHKSQGMSLDAAVIDLRKCFAPGMGYVALSRVRSLEQVYLIGINGKALQLAPEIRMLDRELRAASARLDSMARHVKRRRSILQALLSARA